MSERNDILEKEFQKWQGKYEIPLEAEFNVETLIKLQEEYNNIKPANDNTRTRETLLSMINRVQNNIRLTPKIEVKFDTNMYIDVYKNNKFIRINIYIDKDIFYINIDEFMSMDNASQIILRYADFKKSNIYVDEMGFGTAMLDDLRTNNKEKYRMIVGIKPTKLT